MSESESLWTAMSPGPPWLWKLWGLEELRGLISAFFFLKGNIVRLTTGCPNSERLSAISRVLHYIDVV